MKNQITIFLMHFTYNFQFLVLKERIKPSTFSYNCITKYQYLYCGETFILWQWLSDISLNSLCSLNALARRIWRQAKHNSCTLLAFLIWATWRMASAPLAPTMPSYQPESFRRLAMTIRPCFSKCKSPNMTKNYLHLVHQSISTGVASALEKLVDHQLLRV